MLRENYHRKTERIATNLTQLPGELQGLARVRASLQAFVRDSPPEKGFHTPVTQPEKVGKDGQGAGLDDGSWPSEGEVVLEDVVLRYPTQVCVCVCVRVCVCIHLYVYV